MIKEEFNKKVYDLILSRDIGNYLRDKNYKFNVIEAAFIIYANSKIILDDKLKLWDEILNNSDDMTLEGYNYPSEFTSMHDTIREYMNIVKSEVEIFKNSGDCMWYLYIKSHNDNDTKNIEKEFKNYSEVIDCLKHLNPFIYVEISCMNRNTNIYRARFDSNADIIEFYPDKKDLTIHKESVIELFHDTYLELPIPFKKGDIIVNKNPTNIDYGVPIVFEKSCHELAKGRRGADRWDMLLCGFFLDNKNDEEHKFTIDHCYLNYEFMHS